VCLPAKRILSVIFVLAALCASGCATMDKNECLTVDWRTVGYEDGAAGYSGERIGNHRRACAKHGVAPDLGEYQLGRDAGLREYCVPVTGFRIGSQGYSYNGVCPPELDREFLSAFEVGRHLYELRAKVAAVNDQLNTKRNALEDAQAKIAEQTALIASNEATREQRVEAAADVKHLAEKIGRLKEEIRRLERDKIHYERDVEDYRATLTYGS
jgi:hypothetical protein